jgi:hypothetical protein
MSHSSCLRVRIGKQLYTVLDVINTLPNQNEGKEGNDEVALIS